MRKSDRRNSTTLVLCIVIGFVLILTPIIIMRGFITIRLEPSDMPDMPLSEKSDAQPTETAEVKVASNEAITDEAASEEADSDDNESLEQVSYDVTVNPAQDPSIAPVLPDDYSRWTEDQKTRLNLFLSNFSEVFMPSFTPAYATGAELLWYVDRHLFINNNSEISYSSDNAQRFSNASAQNCLERYFGVSLEPKDYSGIVSGAQRSYKYIDGYFCNYSWGIGEAYNRFSIVSNAYKNSDGSITAEFKVYELDIEEYHANGLTRSIYAMRPENIMQHRPAVSLVEGGTAQVRPYTKSDGGPSYQLLSYYVEEAKAAPDSDKRAEFTAKAEAIRAEMKAENTSNYSNYEMSESASRFYEKWDALLNEVYHYLRDTLPADEFERLKAEEIRWIQERDAAADAAGAAFQGGTGAGLARISEGSRQTEERVYVLIGMVN